MPLTLGLRPRLELNVPGGKAVQIDAIRSVDGRCTVTRVQSYLVITIPESRQHFWSPQLQVEIEETPEGLSVRGLITPMPAVWTLFAAMYGVILVFGFFGTMFGLAQLQLGQPPHGLWSIPAASAALFAVYAAALAGQHLGRNQTRELVSLLREMLGPAAAS